MQVDFTAHDPGHQDIAVDLIKDQIKQRYRKSRRSILRIRDKYRRHSTHQGTNHRHSLGHDRQETKNQRELDTQYRHAHSNTRTRDQAQFTKPLDICAQRSADLIQNMRHLRLRIISKQIDHHQTQLTPVLQKVKS